MASSSPPAPDAHSPRADRVHPPIQEDGGIRILPVEALSRDGIVAAVPMLLVETCFSRDFEREADEHAASYLAELVAPPGRAS